MSEQQWGGGTATVMPPSGPGAPPSTSGAATPPPGGGGVPVWVLIAVAIAVAALAGTGTYLWAQSRVAAERARLAVLELANSDLEAKVAELETRVIAASADATTAADATAGIVATAAPPAKPKPPAATTKRYLALVKKVTWSAAKGYQLSADYVQLLTGDAAAAAASAAGEESPPPNDYFLVNSSAKLRTLRLPKTSPVFVLDWGGASGTTPTKIPVGQFMDIMPGGTNPQDPWQDGYYWLTVKNGTTILKIQQQYFP